ncbi:MAG: vWA domain-containing protein [Sediminispirochaetaceae bacterium]
MMKMQIVFYRFFSVLCILVFMGGATLQLQADSREGNLDVFLLLDRSLSMEQEFQSLQKYVENNVFDTVLQSGDSLNMIAFYGETQPIVSGVFGHDVELSELNSLLYSLQADRHYTDIGSALDLLEKSVATNSRAGYPSYVLLLTDGIHEGPPGSPYPGKTDTFSHPLLELQKQSQFEGWNICLLAITVEDKADELAEEVISAWQARN